MYVVHLLQLYDIYRSMYMLCRTSTIYDTCTMHIYTLETYDYDSVINKIKYKLIIGLTPPSVFCQDQRMYPVAHGRVRAKDRRQRLLPCSHFLLPHLIAVSKEQRDQGLALACYRKLLACHSHIAKPSVPGRRRLPKNCLDRLFAVVAIPCGYQFWMLMQFGNFCLFGWSYPSEVLSRLSVQRLIPS